MTWCGNTLFQGLILLNKINHCPTSISCKEKEVRTTSLPRHLVEQPTRERHIWAELERFWVFRVSYITYCLLGKCKTCPRRKKKNKDMQISPSFYEKIRCYSRTLYKSVYSPENWCLVNLVAQWAIMLD